MTAVAGAVPASSPASKRPEPPDPEKLDPEPPLSPASGLDGELWLTDPLDPNPADAPDPVETPVPTPVPTPDPAPPPGFAEFDPHAKRHSRATEANAKRAGVRARFHPSSRAAYRASGSWGCVGGKDLLPVSIRRIGFQPRPPPAAIWRAEWQL
jgi:hypothetical protein